MKSAQLLTKNFSFVNQASSASATNCLLPLVQLSTAHEPLASAPALSGDPSAQQPHGMAAQLALQQQAYQPQTQQYSYWVTPLLFFSAQPNHTV